MKLIIRVCAVLASSLYMASCSSQPAGPVTKPVAWVLDEGLCEPETAVLNPASNELIISNICGFNKNGEGYLSRVSLDGEMIEARWIEDMDAPAGMARLGDTLYVVDVERVHAIDLISEARTKILGPFEGAKAFNDIAVDTNGVLYVSDSARGHVLRIVDGIAEPFPNNETEFKFANGMHIEGETLYVGGEKFWSVDLSTGSVEIINIEGVADIDGIESDGKGGLSVSIVGGNVWHLPVGGPPQEWTAEGVSSTNHAHLPIVNLIVVPTGYDNTLIAFTP